MGYRKVLAISLSMILLLQVGAFNEVYAPVSAYSVSKTLAAGDNPIAFRDSFNTAAQTATITLDVSTSGSGFVTIQVIEDDSNLDATAIDVIFASITSTTSGMLETQATLTETGTDTGVFEGTVDLSTELEPGKLQVSPGDLLNAVYTAKNFGVGRLSATLTGVAGVTPVDVEIFDFTITTVAEKTAACPFDLVIHPVIIQYPLGTTASEITVTISYANALLITPLTTYAPTDLKLLYRIGDAVFPISAFSPFKLAPGTLSPITVDTTAKTITATLVNGAVFPTLSGQYALGVSIAGCFGGGGGGIVVTPGDSDVNASAELDSLELVEVDIDIKPDSVNCKANKKGDINGVVPIEISSNSVDVTPIDLTTLTLNAVGTSEVHDKLHIDDSDFIIHVPKADICAAASGATGPVDITLAGTITDFEISGTDTLDISDIFD